MKMQFSRCLLEWSDRAGRKALPWQRNPTPYRVWVSEIMLQQTQVATVIPYFERFTARFPDVRALARAPLDEVLHLWSGLGYYARARNLHRTARIVCDERDGRFPQTLEDLTALPGIGRSTAGAVLALASGIPQAILDGNVKRVLTRAFAIAGWPGSAAVQTELWALAEQLLPRERVAAYTQAIMDLGATVCTRARPLCEQCPLESQCAARLQGRIAEFPAPKPRRALPLRAATLLLMTDPQGAVLLERRPPSGIWGGLWSLPECPPERAPEQWCADAFGFAASATESLPALRHSFTHFRLDITPMRILGELRDERVMEGNDRLWYKSDAADALGLPAPIAKLLQQTSRQGEAENDDA